MQWQFQILSKAPETVVEKIAMVLWGIWRARSEKLWQKPQAPAIKCNIDATLQNDMRKTGMGMALRD